MKNLSWKAFLPLGIFLFLVVSFAIGLTLKPATLDSPLIGKPLPPFELESVFEGEPPVRSAEMKGRFTLLNVFGSWCVACRVEHPFLVELQETEDIHIVGLDWRDKRPDAIAWLERHGNPYDQVGFDEISEVAVDLGVTGAPETYLVDPEGIVRFKYVGPLDKTVWLKEFLPRMRDAEPAS